MTATAERAKLRNAIADQRAAEHTLEEAQLARANAENRWSAASSRIGEINAEIADAQEHAEHSTDAVISALAVGGDVLDKPSAKLDELRVALDAAEIESAKWHHAIKIAEQAIEFRRQAVDLAAHYVDVAARKVVGAECNTAALLCAAEALRSELLDAQARLAAIARGMEHDSEQRRTIDNFTNNVGWLLDTPWRDRPAAQPIRDQFAALKADASAALKS